MRVLVLVVALSCSGCAGFFVGLGILIQCGPMPMGPSDCEPTRRPPKPDAPYPAWLRATNPEDYR
jgi:hypothetical protein